jgi:hypothetical protein
MPEVDLDPFEEIFRASLFKMLKDEEKISDALINKRMRWKHSGFRVHKGVRVARDDEKGSPGTVYYP